MPVNLDKPHRWKQDTAQSVDLYNSWYLEFAPRVYREKRIETTRQVQEALSLTANLTSIAPRVLEQYPAILPMLRMSTAPPLARDRLIGLSGVSPRLVSSMEEEQRIPPRMGRTAVERDLSRIGSTILKLVDPDIFPWLSGARAASEAEVYRASTIVADRLCGTLSNPIIRNAQERRQLALIGRWLDERGYTRAPFGARFQFMAPGTYAFHQNVLGSREDGSEGNITIDAVIMLKTSRPGDLPLLIEAKSAGDYTNTNKRRKEEATKVAQLRRKHGEEVRFILFLCGYFDAPYLGYEAAEGIDWVWEHRIDDLAEFGVQA